MDKVFVKCVREVLISREIVKGDPGIVQVTDAGIQTESNSCCGSSRKTSRKLKVTSIAHNTDMKCISFCNMFEKSETSMLLIQSH